MIIEISNFNYIKKNQTKFIKLIENFNIKEDENGKRITKNEIIEKLLEKNEFNLLLAKKK